MAAAANYAWVNRASMTFLTRKAFAKQFGKTAEELDMHVVYDVSHNIAKVLVNMLAWLSAGCIACTRMDGGPDVFGAVACAPLS